MTRAIRLASLVVSCAALAFTAASAQARQAQWVGKTLDGRPCSDFIGAESRSKVYDYTDPRHRAENLKVVEQAHFTRDIQTLSPTLSASSILNNLEYTAGRFPNHHGALYTMIRFATETGFRKRAKVAWSTPRDREGSESLPPECYLQRAADFAPDDHQVRLLTGLYYHRMGAHERAHDAYEEALALAPESAEAHYNHGLLLLDMGRYEEARKHARKAYALGYPLNGLREQLAAAGHPVDP